MRLDGHRRLGSVLAVLALAVAACGGDDEPELAVSDEPSAATSSETETPDDEPTEDEPTEDPDALATTASEPDAFATTAEEPGAGLGTTAEEPPPPPPTQDSEPLPSAPPPEGDVPALLVDDERQEVEDLCVANEVIVVNYVFEASIEFTPIGQSTVGVRAFTTGDDVIAYGTQTDTDDAVVLEAAFDGGEFADVTLLLDPAADLPACPFAYEPTPVPAPGQ